MKSMTLQAAIGSALLLLAAQPCHAGTQQQHRHVFRHTRHYHNSAKRDFHAVNNETLSARYDAPRSETHLHARGGVRCQHSKEEGISAVTPNPMNGRWALVADQECADDAICPIAYPSGQLMAQWRPDTHYAIPGSHHGGIYSENGEIEIPLGNESWCVDGASAGAAVSFCQNLRRGYEDMLMLTDIDGTFTLAGPNPSSYWDSTAAHLYGGALGVSPGEDGSRWIDELKLVNWAYVTGDDSANTLAELRMDPVCQDGVFNSDKPATSTPMSTSATSLQRAKTTSSSSSTTLFLGAVYSENEPCSDAEQSREKPTATSAPAAESTGGSGSASTSGAQDESESTSGEKTSPENAGRRQDGASVAGLIVAFVAAVYLL